MGPLADVTQREYSEDNAGDDRGEQGYPPEPDAGNGIGVGSPVLGGEASSVQEMPEDVDVIAPNHRMNVALCRNSKPWRQLVGPHSCFALRSSSTTAMGRQ
jgi:hypothetical protein